MATDVLLFAIYKDKQGILWPGTHNAGVYKYNGKSHHQYINEEILIPLKLNNTFSSLYEVDIKDVMSRYFIGWEPDLKQNKHGNKIATAEDVGIFLRALAHRL